MMRCHLIVHSNSRHLQQLYTGFFLLHRSGQIRLSQSLIRPPNEDAGRAERLRDAQHAQLDVILNGDIRLRYDVHDDAHVDPQALHTYDHYFKRSHAGESLQALGADRSKVHPLGLYYPVFPSHVDPFALHRALLPGLAATARLVQLDRSLDPMNLLRQLPRLDAMRAFPDGEAAPRILFMTRAWETDDDPRRPAEENDQRAALNDMRAACIRRLRVEFGPRFYGGFLWTDFAMRNYRESLIPESRLGDQANYLRLLRDFPIGIATTGLHGSIGAKLAEYIAFSRAIVSEKLKHEVPGDLRPERNYLEFASADGCVEQATRLIEDPGLRGRIMAENSQYYEESLRPDRLVLRTLQIASGQAAENS